MTTPQSGIFALGTSSHAYLEFDLRPGAGARDLIVAMANLREPRTTIGGINLVSGFRPELWRGVVPNGLPRDLTGFNENIVGADRYVIPATQHDAVLWLSGSAYDVVFDESRGAIAALSGLASIADETSSWAYRYDHDLTGFIDGTENPSLLEAPGVLAIPDGRPGAGGTVLLLQKWVHDAAKWEALDVAAQERAIGRRKADSAELDPKPKDSHVARTDQDAFGHVFRRNMPFGTVTNHGTMFVGFTADQQRLAKMLESMAGVTDGIRDALTNYTKAISGAYYFIPSVEALSQFLSP